jgi:hypothetical protein
MQLPRSIKMEPYRSHWLYRILSTLFGIKIRAFTTETVETVRSKNIDGHVIRRVGVRER